MTGAQRTFNEEVLERLATIEAKIDATSGAADAVTELSGRVGALETWRNSIVGAVGLLTAALGFGLIHR